MPKKETSLNKFTLTSSISTIHWIFGDRHTHSQKNRKISCSKCHWKLWLVTIMSHYSTPSWDQQSPSSKIPVYQSTKIFLYLLVGFPLLILPYDLCLKVQASLAHSHLQTMWNSLRCNTYPQLLLIGILLILLILGSDTKRMVSAERLKSKEQTGQNRKKETSLTVGSKTKVILNDRFIFFNIYEGCSKSTASYLIMLVHKNRGGSQLCSSRDLDFPTVLH